EDTERARARFEREAQATALLRSPHTVELFDFGITEGGDYYYVMELLDGVDLQRLVERYGPLPPARVVHLVSQACLSLAEAHARGLVHRDIKPSNLVVTRAGVEADFAKVLDFGLVAEEPDRERGDPALNKTGLVGTPAFISPEVASGGEAAPAADVYGLGCVAYWLLTGQLVFEARGALEMIFAHEAETPAPPSDRLGVDPGSDLDGLVLSCLAKDPSERPSALDLRQRLLACDVGRAWSEGDADRFWKAHASGVAPPAAALHENPLARTSADAIWERSTMRGDE
ncbi:MAG: serine/threonine-protein kinase, partial [Planctomycetota bacterium]